METPVFDELSTRPWSYCARALDPGTLVAADCAPLTYLRLSGAWHDQDTVRDLDEVLRRRDLARAAQAQKPFACQDDTPTELIPVVREVLVP